MGLERCVSDNPNLNMAMVLSHSTKDWNWDGVSLNPGITMDDIQQHPHLPWTTDIARNEFKKDKQAYVDSKMSRLGLLSLMDEDYFREEGVLNRDNCMDLVFQSEYLVSLMSAYL